MDLTVIQNNLIADEIHLKIEKWKMILGPWQKSWELPFY